MSAPLLYGGLDIAPIISIPLVVPSPKKHLQYGLLQMPRCDETYSNLLIGLTFELVHLFIYLLTYLFVCLFVIFILFHFVLLAHFFSLSRKYLISVVLGQPCLGRRPTGVAAKLASIHAARLIVDPRAQLLPHHRLAQQTRPCILRGVFSCV